MSWGMKSGGAAELLASWRLSHELEIHYMCRSYFEYAQDVKNGVPESEARLHLGLASWSRRHGVPTGFEIIKLGRAYRPWEGKENEEAFKRELRRLLRKWRLLHEPVDIVDILKQIDDRK